MRLGDRQGITEEVQYFTGDKEVQQTKFVVCRKHIFITWPEMENGMALALPVYAQN